MFRQILLTQWKWTRLSLGALMALSFLFPITIWNLWGLGGDPVSASGLLLSFEQMGAVLALIASLGGFVLAVQPWSADAATSHVYPLSLPLPWSRYLIMRFGAGALSLVLPAIALWLGCLGTLSLIEIPPTMRTYAGTVALRFLFASLLGYSAVFALQYLSGRRAVLVMISTLLAILVFTVSVDLFGLHALRDWIGRVLFEWPGPLAIFTADWSLIDV